MQIGHLGVELIKMKEYLVKNIEGKYVLTFELGLTSDNVIEIPNGTNIVTRHDRVNSEVFFHWKSRDSDEFYLKDEKVWDNNFGQTLHDYLDQSDGEGEIIWDRNEEYLEEDTSKDCRLGWFEKFLNGVKIQYKLDAKEDSQWHNMTEGALKYFQRKDIKLREAPKHVKVNGIEFKSADKILKYVKNNFDIEE